MGSTSDTHLKTLSSELTAISKFCVCIHHESASEREQQSNCLCVCVFLIKNMTCNSSENMIAFAQNLFICAGSCPFFATNILVWRVTRTTHTLCNRTHGCDELLWIHSIPEFLVVQIHTHTQSFVLSNLFLWHMYVYNEEASVRASIFSQNFTWYHKGDFHKSSIKNKVQRILSRFILAGCIGVWNVF